MNKSEDIQNRLSALKKNLQGRYPISALALFGSYSRGDQDPESDIDIMVEFNGRIGSRFILLAEELEEELGQKVDLVSRNGIKDKYFEIIMPDLIYV